VGTVAALRDAWPDLRDVTLVGVDLSREDLDWSLARLEHTMMLGCTLAAGVTDELVALGVSVFPAPSDLPFAAYRSALYTGDELTAVADPAVTGQASSQTLDERIGAWFLSSSTSMHDAVIRAVHDATIDAAIARFVQGRRVVGVMGGHALDRDAAFFRSIARVGRSLTRAGFSIATGGGPGAMEAANLGAWMAPFADDALDEAIRTLAASPEYASDPAAYRQRALDVRSRWPNGGESLGVPTWVYVDEPTSVFATHIAK